MRSHNTRKIRSARATRTLTVAIVFAIIATAFIGANIAHSVVDTLESAVR